MSAVAEQLPVVDPAPEQRSETNWPSSPYRGLNYYGPEHLPLFAGREQDVERAAELMAPSAIRLFALHGASGCGKSSLLRAALVPLLEGEFGTFRFLRQGDRSAVVFIRCTSRPLLKLAEELYRFIDKGFDLETPRGTRHVSLKADCTGDEGLDEFLKRVSGSPGLLLEAVASVVRRVPRTLVLVVDQAEEVLTLIASQAGEDWRQQFWEFLALLTNAKIDLKVVVCLRTEYYGRFRHELSEMGARLEHVAEYYLGPLRERDLAAAIERPTLTRSVGAFGAPRDRYKFSFAPGVALRIAQEIVEAAPPGGVLPTLQMVCARLYREAVKPGNVSEITLEQFRKLGSIDEQLYDHLDSELQAVLENLQGITDTSDLRQRWKTLLSELVHLQVDGTVTTEMQPFKELQNKAKKLGLPRFQETMTDLCSEERRICRTIRVLRLARDKEDDAPRTEILSCYALGHDALGLALQRWRTLSEYAADSARRLGQVGSVMVLLGLGLCGFGIATERFWAAIFGGYFVLAGAVYVVMWRFPSTRYGLIGRLIDNRLREKQAKQRSASGAWLTPKSHPLTDVMSDPQAGRWGGEASRDGLKLTASVASIPGDSNYIAVTLCVAPTDGEANLEGVVRFHLHPTFAIPDPGVEVRERRATLQLKTWGAFTVGVETDGGTQLELDLAHVLPEPFRSR